MPLPKIDAITPITLTPTTITEYNESFMTCLNVNAIPDGAWPASATFKPFNYAANVLAPHQHGETLTIPDLRVEASKYPKVAQSLGLTLYVLAVLRKLDALNKQLQTLTSNQQTLTTALESLNKQLESASASLDAANELPNTYSNKQEAITRATTRISTLENQIATSESQLAAIDLTALNTDITALEGQLA